MPARPSPVVFGHRAARVLGSLEPVLLAASRLWLAQAFIVLQVTMSMRGIAPGDALHGAWWQDTLHRIVASGFGTGLQALCPVLVAIGLFGRGAATLLLVQVLLIRILPLDAAGEPSSVRVFWVALLVAIIIRGPGSLSLDAAVGPGLRNSAVPFAKALQRLGRRLATGGTPLLLLALRVLAAAILVKPFFAGGQTSTVGASLHLQAMSRMLPGGPGALLMLDAAAAATLAACLLCGLAVRPIALVLVGIVAFGSQAKTVDADASYWCLVLGFLVVEGSGRFSLDRAIGTALQARKAARPRPSHHVVIVGGGFGGYAAARGLRDHPCRVTVIDRSNHHLFQPLLYQVATAGLSPADVATPIRAMLRNQPNARVLLAEATGVDPSTREVICGDRRIAYDTLVLATGARHSYFGRDEWSPVAPGLKTVEDATAIRRRLLLAFECAESAGDPDDRRAWLTFAIIGGGPTGVELAGAIAELAREGMEGEFRDIDPASARVVLIQSAPRLLPTFAPDLSNEARCALEALGVEVWLDTKAEAIDSDGVATRFGRLPARTVLWAAGVEASPAAKWLDARSDRSGRILVEPDLTVPGHHNIFAIGDTCATQSWNGMPAPGLAPAAKQAGAYVAGVVAARLRGGPAPPPFRYRHYGSLATIGRKAAVADFGFLHCRGAVAWWLWGAAHLLFLVDSRNRTGVVAEWLWDYVTLRRGTRLIIGEGTASVTSPTRTTAPSV